MPDKFDPMKGERKGSAWIAILAMLDDREWHPWSEVVSHIADESGLQAKMISNLLHDGVQNGVFDRQGKYHRDPAYNTRAIRLQVQP